MERGETKESLNDSVEMLKTRVGDTEGQKDIEAENAKDVNDRENSYLCVIQYASDKLRRKSTMTNCDKRGRWRPTGKPGESQKS